MICQECGVKMFCTETRNYTDPSNGFYYVQRRKKCPSCDQLVVTIEVDQKLFTEMKIKFDEQTQETSDSSE
jgi:transcriptional regulator NrdR family protein